VGKARALVTPDTAIRLARHFGSDAQSWLNLQSAFDLCRAELALRATIEREV
jgi:addiction module HigA family antidote